MTICGCRIRERALVSSSHTAQVPAVLSAGSEAFDK
jgi:hypothetical protein